MIETKDLILKKAVFEDWSEIYNNVWSRPDCAKYMYWTVTTNEEDAKARILRTIKWQSEHDAYFIYEKTTQNAIGFTGVEPVTEDAPPDESGIQTKTPNPVIFEEGGICIGTEYQKKGYGRQVVQALLDYVREKYGATEFQYSSREANIPSRKLAESFGFMLHHKKHCTDPRDGIDYTMLVFRKKL